ncbi:hypothetical protein J7K41_02785 [Candidatus Micrarchaeota archaeon]|nr:hypothetical protein [Candidatus Micrarchaeota archaeon]
MLSTGDRNIDLFLEGGLPPRSNVLLLSRPGQEKTVFALQFLWAGLKEGDMCIFITTDTFPDSVITEAQRYNWDFGRYLGKTLFFIDCYSWTLGQRGLKERDGIIPVLGPTALNDISIELTKLISSTPNKKRIVFASLSTLLLNNAPESVFRFIHITGARLKSENATSLYLMDEGMHDEKVVSTIQHLMDDTLTIKRSGDSWILFSERLPYREGLKIEFGMHGVRAL